MGDFADVYRGALDAEIEALVRKLADGSCASFDEYRHAAGQLKGLKRAKTVFSETIRKVMESD